MTIPRRPWWNAAADTDGKRAAVVRCIKKTLRSTHALDLISYLAKTDHLAIMLYHGFCESSEPDCRFANLLPISVFEDHIRIYSRYGRPLSLEELKDGSTSGIVVTIDDGYANNYELAFPILEKYRFPATIFVTTGFVDRTLPLWGDWLDFLVMAAPKADTVFEWNGTGIALMLAGAGAAAHLARDLRQRLGAMSPEHIHEFLRRLQEHLQLRYGWDDIPKQLRPLSWDEARAMRRSGLVSFGAHTQSHPVLSRCSADVQKSEINGSKSRLEQELGERCYAFAYPYGKEGDYDCASRSLVQEAGYTLALTAESGFNRPSACDRHALKRWGANVSADELSFLASGAPLITESFRRGVCNRAHRTLGPRT